jgi:regulator of sirC expression with transglutaminase-like and TPR domain
VSVAVIFDKHGGELGSEGYHRTGPGATIRVVSVERLDEARAANRARFARLVARPESEIELARGALLIAADGRPDVDPEASLGMIERLVERVRLRVDRGDPPTTVLDRLHDVLYREVGFRGPSAAEYHDARNSLLDRVLVRRIGLPISLSIVQLEVAGRLGLELWGVGLPGHFIVGGPGNLLVDPTGGGRRLRPDDCQALLRNALGEGVLFHAGMLKPTPRRAILARVLRNLRSVHLAKRDWPAALGIIELLGIVEPADPDHRRDRALLLGRMGRFSEAVAGLSRYLDERPHSHDTAEVRQVIGIFAGRRN